MEHTNQINEGNRAILYSVDTIPKNKKIAIYGSGKIGTGFKQYLEENRSDIIVSYFIDSFKRGFKNGTEVINIHDINEYKHLFDLIIVASSEWNEIEDSLKIRNISHFIISNELLYGTLDIGSLGSFKFEYVDRQNISKRLKLVESFFEDTHRYYFSMLSDLRVLENESSIFDFLKSMKEKVEIPYLEYLDNDFKGDAILEGGVSDGYDSVNFYNFFNNSNIQVFGFEPFIEAFEASLNMPLLIKKGMKVFPFALWNKDIDLYFHKNELSASTSSVVRFDFETNISEYTVVKGVKIDSFVKENLINSVCLLKLDIEGAEMEALEGAREMIKFFKPQLAISIYHKKEHLYEIPELLKELHPGYKFKLGFYTCTFIDTILYAIP